MSQEQKFPTLIPIIAIQGTILMPGTTLPIPITDHDYIELTEECLTTSDLVGVMQPIHFERDIRGRLPLFKAGTLGRIETSVNFDDERRIINIQGICRFDVIEEILHDSGRRYAIVNYDRYLSDIKESDVLQIDRERLFRILSNYFKSYEIKPNWEEIENTPDRRLIAALATLCPLEASEKQAILEQPNFKDQSDLFMNLMEMSHFDHPFIYQSGSVH